MLRQMASSFAIWRFVFLVEPQNLTRLPKHRQTPDSKRVGVHFHQISIPHPGNGSMRIHAGGSGNRVLTQRVLVGHRRAPVATAPMHSNNPLNRQADGVPALKQGGLPFFTAPENHTEGVCGLTPPGCGSLSYEPNPY